MPDVSLRKQHWQRACSESKLRDPDSVSERFRITSGNIHRVARLAESYAALAKRSEITLADAQRATRSLNRQILDALAIRLSASGDWSQLAVGGETRRELENFVSRCRHRERLQSQVGTKANAGVRALFTGPSGTGKTLAARLLASTLQMDVYRLDLSSVINKYIGETEKNLNLILSRAEELDVILLLDEGDSLLTQRTGVQSSNDRYANLETNFLLQRLETFEGILVVTTNANERIDSAFQRRMDVVISFSPPSPPERWAIWQLHLPSDHAVDFSLLEEVAGRCVLSGGQIKNAALHASLLALEDGGIVTSAMIGDAIEREYRKAGGVCPLRRN
jgi:SpoVK/Ycf46/Vps4 family AAA+-type ATPase